MPESSPESGGFKSNDFTQFMTVFSLSVELNLCLSRYLAFCVFDAKSVPLWPSGLDPEVQNGTIVFPVKSEFSKNV